MRKSVLVCVLFSFLTMGRGAEACMSAMEHRVYPLGTVPEGVVAVEWALSRSSSFDPPHYWYGTARLVVLDAAQEVKREIATAPVNTLGPGLQGTLVPLIRAWFEVAGREPGFTALEYRGSRYCSERFVCEGGFEVRWDKNGQGSFIPGEGQKAKPLGFPASFVEAHRRQWEIEDEPPGTVRRILAEDAAEASAVDVAALDQEEREEHFTFDARFRLGIVRHYTAGGRTLLVVGMHRGHFDRDDPREAAPMGGASDRCDCVAVDSCWCPEVTQHHGASFDVLFLL